MTLLQPADTISCAVPGGEFQTAGRDSNAEAERLTAKRVLDIVGALSALIFFGPLMFAIWVALSVSGGSPIFCHKRVGKNGEIFRCYKFRSMVKDANKILAVYLEENPEARAEWDRSFKLACDPRITWFGTFLRRTSMDELPQLFNVLKGEMSLVGPRPIIPSEVERYAGKISAYYSCRPGITGLWQVSGRNLVSYDRRVQLDAFYARKQSLWLDLTILVRTVRVVVSGVGAS
jgi:lipopolysaccharide/colanic/teichoic acid biosynthesis glycosyltransferase